MKRYINFASLVGVVLLAVVISLPLRVKAQSNQPEQKFPNAFVVREPFLSYYQRAGGEAQYGKPITGDYVDPATGLLVQYFANVRMEWHPGNPDPYKIQLGLLGDEMGKRQPPIPISQMPAPNDPNCLNFIETGHSLCMQFREYWLANGSLDRFGYPIGEYTIENDQLVQYFQRARLEWHPGKPEGQRVQLAPLGEIFYKWARLDIGRLDPYNTANSAGINNGPLVSVTALQPRASVFNPVAVANGPQTAFVYVVDQLNRPVNSAAVTLVLRYPDRDETFTLPPTSATGTSYQTFVVPQVIPGNIISMEFIISYNGLFAQTRTSYMVWY